MILMSGSSIGLSGEIKIFFFSKMFIYTSLSGALDLPICRACYCFIAVGQLYWE